MLRILHTADWHIGRTFGQFDAVASGRLARDRVAVIERILGLADQRDVHAVLCAGDLFDSPDPGEPWWRAVAEVFERFGRQRNWTRPVVLLPGNHDPLNSDSVYQPRHPFRGALPAWVHVVDRDDFQLEFGGAIVLAAPCRSTAGDRDLAMALPARSDGDLRIRIGLVHGSTFDIPDYATNFPISTDAPAERGLDYLALGDTHGFREPVNGAVAPIVYPGAPEPTRFGERDAGFVAVVSFRRQGIRPRIQRERVARWTWRQETVRSLVELHALAADDLQSTVLKLTLDMTVLVADVNAVDRVLASLAGTEAAPARAGALVCDRTNLRIRADEPLPLDAELPESIRETAARLQAEAADPVAQRALVLLNRLLHEVR